MSNEIIKEAEDLLASVTSVPTGSEIQEIKKMENVPSELTLTFYHVVVDSDFGNFLRNVDRNAVVFGRILNTQNMIEDRIPILFDRDEAINVAKKLINMIINSGSSGVENDKRYPYLGAVIVGLNFEEYQNVSHNKVELSVVNGKLDYSNLSGEQDLILYSVQNATRGLLKKSVLKNTGIVNSQYVVRNDINVDNGFALLNLCSTLTVEDIKTLKCLYLGEKSPCFDQDSHKRKNYTKINLEIKPVIQLGGKYNNIGNLARREKAKYLLNKSKQNGGLDEILYKQKYIDAKAEYLIKKKQTGGNNDEDLDRKKYIEIKTKYIEMKKKQEGGLLEPTDSNVATSDEAYWKPRYERKKKNYLEKKN